MADQSSDLAQTTRHSPSSNTPLRRQSSVFSLRADATVVPVGTHIRGDIECNDVIIHGNVTGFVKATGRVLVNVGAEVIGGITATAEVVVAGKVIQSSLARAAICSQSGVVLTHSADVCGDIHAARVTAWRDEIDSTHARVLGRFLPLLR